jgi:hypothetical protein
LQSEQWDARLPELASKRHSGVSIANREQPNCQNNDPKVNQPLVPQVKNVGRDPDHREYTKNRGQKNHDRQSWGIPPEANVLRRFQINLPNPNLKPALR